ncbi:hypothetical protein GGI43DRAFT_237600 [Trichoderma evansii]
MEPVQAVQPRENRTIALLDGFQQTRPSVSQAAGCLRPAAIGHQPRPVACTQSESRAAIKPPPPKGSPATFNFARFQTSKTSYLKLILSLTPLVLPSRAVATLELLFVVIISWSSSLRFLFLDCFDTHLPSTLFYLSLRLHRRPL